jgi:hypothetical protein
MVPSGHPCTSCNISPFLTAAVWLTQLIQVSAPSATGPSCLSTVVTQMW